MRNVLQTCDASIFSTTWSGLVELHLAYNKLSVWLVCRVEVRRRTEREQAHKVL